MHEVVGRFLSDVLMRMWCPVSTTPSPVLSAHPAPNKHERKGVGLTDLAAADGMERLVHGPLHLLHVVDVEGENLRRPQRLQVRELTRQLQQTQRLAVNTRVVSVQRNKVLHHMLQVRLSAIGRMATAGIRSDQAKNLVLDPTFLAHTNAFDRG